MADPTHECPCGCRAQIPRHLFACRTGWARLPAPYSGAITRGYRHRQADGGRAHRAAMLAAFGWYRRNPRTAP